MKLKEKKAVRSVRSKNHRRMNGGKVAAGFSMSLDGFIAGPNDDLQRVFAWMFSGDRDLKVSIGNEEMALKLSEKSQGERISV